MDVKQKWMKVEEVRDLRNAVISQKSFRWSFVLIQLPKDVFRFKSDLPSLYFNYYSMIHLDCNIL